MGTKKFKLTLAICAFMGAAPAFAQSEEAVEGAVEAASDAVEAVADPVPAPPQIQVQPAPPVVEIARPLRDPRAKRPRDPRLKKFQFINQADYPVASWQADEEGIVGYQVEVDAEGQPLSCKIIENSGYSALDDATCPLVMERAEFRPAQNIEREDVDGTYTGSQRWRKQEPEMPQMSIIFQYTHDEMGRSKDCKFLKMEDLPEKMRKDIERDKERGKLCPGPTTKQGIPYRDENGVPVAKLVTVSFDVVLEEPVDAPAE